MKRLIPALVLVAVIVVALVLTTRGGEEEPATQRPPSVPAINVAHLDGSAEFALADLASAPTPTLLWFWAPWCPICAGEAPAIETARGGQRGPAGDRDRRPRQGRQRPRLHRALRPQHPDDPLRRADGRLEPLQDPRPARRDPARPRGRRTRPLARPVQQRRGPGRRPARCEDRRPRSRAGRRAARVRSRGARVLRRAARARQRSRSRPSWPSAAGSWFEHLHVGVEDPFTPARKAHPALKVDDLDALAGRSSTTSPGTRRSPACAGSTQATRSATGWSSSSTDFSVASWPLNWRLRTGCSTAA